MGSITRCRSGCGCGGEGDNDGDGDGDGDGSGNSSSGSWQAGGEGKSSTRAGGGSNTDDCCRLARASRAVDVDTNNWLRAFFTRSFFFCILCCRFVLVGPGIEC